jgi:hypothetical protein
MLMIRDEQMATLRRSRWENLIEAMTVDLPVEYPDSFGRMDLDELQSFVREQVTAARGYGFRSFDLVRRYLLVAGRAGSLDATENSDWAVPLLEDEISTPERRMNELEDWAGRMTSQGPSPGVA